MKLTKRELTIWARTLIMAFLFVFVGKDWHAFTAHHHDHSCCHQHTDSNHKASFKGCCVVCDFDLYKAEAATYFFYAPVLRFIAIEYMVLSLNTVYRAILFVNAHSPPLSH